MPRHDPTDPTTEADAAADVVAFLGSAAAFPGHPCEVQRYETHGAMVFAAGDTVYKIKRAVRFPYMDFSTLALRERVIRREFAINAPNAPELYLGVVAITREADGSLAVGGRGQPVEWALAMRRFRDADLLSAIAARGGLDKPLALACADEVARSHARAEVVVRDDGAARCGRLVEQVAAGLAAEAHAIRAEEAARFGAAARAQISRHGRLIDRRAASGRVRRCHGDLHLGNIVLWRGRPVLFDALEFDDELATVDTLYDLAFLLMDLDAGGHRAVANLVLNRYLLRQDDEADVDGLALLPLFLATRAAIRAMVGAERAGQESGDRRRADVARARRYLDRAQGYLSPEPARLVAVGGFSGTGKSTLAAALAPTIGAAPGALHVRADVERKAMFGVAENVRLPAESYTAEAAQRVYAAMMDKTRRALAAGHSVVIDAVFSRPDERAAVEAAARQTGARFTGLWLAAPRPVLLDRVAGRRDDASDATVDVVAGQLARGAGDVAWTTVAAGGTADATHAAAVAALVAQSAMPS